MLQLDARLKFGRYRNFFKESVRSAPLSILSEKIKIIFIIIFVLGFFTENT